MKKVINSSVSEYDVFVRGKRYSVKIKNYGIFEDEIAKEFLKYFPTVLRMEDIKVVVVPQTETPKTEIKEKVEQKVAEKTVKKIKENVFAGIQKRGRPKKTKK